VDLQGACRAGVNLKSRVYNLDKAGVASKKRPRRLRQRCRFLKDSGRARGMGIVMSRTKKTDELELLEDAWSRFERALELVLKSPPQHRTVKKAKSAKKRALRIKSKSAPRAS
jgi:hypothetical protein